MTVYYYQNGFLDTDEEAPAGAVALTASEHESLIVGQPTVALTPSEEMDK